MSMPKSRGQLGDHLLLFRPTRTAFHEFTAGFPLTLNPLPRRGRGEGEGDAGFFERDWSLAWANFLLQEAGFFTLAEADRFDISTLGQHRFVYLPASLAEALKREDSSAFRSFVEAGGTLVLEGPAADLFDFSGIRFSPEKKKLRTITQVEANCWPAPMVESLKQMPFETLGWELESSGEGAEIILEMDERPVFFRRALGKGKVFSLGFDFGLLLVGFQQGIPAEGAYKLQKLFGTQGRVREPEDLVVKASLLTSSVPWADLFERFLFKVFTKDAPAPRWWYFPHGVTGALISTHDEEAIGPDPRLEAMLKEEKSQGVRGTLFVISHGKFKERWENNGRLSEWERDAAEIGLHWNRFKKPRLKFRRLEWGKHEEPLGRQLRALEGALKKSVQINRTHYLALGEVYDDHFKRLSSHGIYLDSTYGPNQGGRGYLFGTGYPYYGMTWEGELSGVLELPFQLQETWGGANLEFLKLLLAESDENFHQVVVTNFHPHYRILEPEGRGLWLGGLEFARERNQWIPSIGEFFDFFRGRSESAFRSEEKGGSLLVTTLADRNDLALSFPALGRKGRKYSEARVDGQKVSIAEIQNAWFPEVMIPVPQGEHQLEVIYER